MAHPVTTHCWVARRWVKSGDQVELVEIILRVRRDLDVVLLDLWDLWAMGVVVAVRVTALGADGFHGVLGLLTNCRPCRMSSGLLMESRASKMASLA